MDLLARMIERLRHIEPTFSETMAVELELQLRREFGGEECRIYKRIPPDELADRVRRRFNGRNAGQVAEELGIHRATVYRVLKKA
ncbi:Mor transcription activator family protein [Aromatoleum toluclasticum]|uniref:Mor transcription activator family protein n=1 Tax=Aromatoleum toluclasticum TaxID=92003 RepID=UPI000362CD27|nr:Mor transcription activator family protein [Aromatoleum toluclasticum]